MWCSFSVCSKLNTGYFATSALARVVMQEKVLILTCYLVRVHLYWTLSVYPSVFKEKKFVLDKACQHSSQTIWTKRTKNALFKINSYVSATTSFCKCLNCGVYQCFSLNSKPIPCTVCTHRKTSYFQLQPKKFNESGGFLSI